MIEHLKGREQALAPLGWTGREAEWIALVCLHSGVFHPGSILSCYFDAQTDHGVCDSSSHWWSEDRRWRVSGR